MIKRLLNLIVLILIVLVGCQNAKNEKQLSSLVTDLTCNPPCWQNIVPGETTVENLKVLLATIPGIDFNNII